MLHIKCPYCGTRSQNEFAYGGDATVKRPELNKEVSDQEWDTFVYLRKSPRGKHLELWHHISGCRQWFKVQRDTIRFGDSFGEIMLRNKLSYSQIYNIVQSIKDSFDVRWLTTGKPYTILSSKDSLANPEYFI